MVTTHNIAPPILTKRMEADLDLRAFRAVQGRGESQTEARDGSSRTSPNLWDA